MEDLPGLKSAIATVLRRVRREARLSQQKLADFAGLSRIHIAQLEGRRQNATLNVLLLIAMALNLDVLGIKQSTISESKKRGTVPPGWFLVLFEMRGVNPDWLKQGKGPIYLRTEDGRYMEPEPAATPLGRGVSLPYYDSDRVQDGVWEPSGTIMLPEPYAGKELRILRITGDSFSPTVRQGAFVGVDTSSVRPSSGSIFAVFVPFEGVVIKRVFCDSDTLLLRTDNPLHPSMSIPLAEAGRLIGRVAWVFQAL